MNIIDVLIYVAIYYFIVCLVRRIKEDYKSESDNPTLN